LLHLVGCLYYYNTNYLEDNSHTFEMHYWTLMGDNICKNVQYCYIDPNLGIIFFTLIFVLTVKWGHEVAHLFDALRYKPDGHGFDPRLCHWNF